MGSNPATPTTCNAQVERPVSVLTKTGARVPFSREPSLLWFESGSESEPSYRGYTSAMKTAISVPDPLFEKADELAHRLHISRSELYANALRAFVEGHDEEAKRRVLDEIYAEESSALPPGAVQAQARIASEWDE